MKTETIKINKNGETLTITRSRRETNGAVTEFEGTDEPGIGPPMHVHFKQEEMVKVVKGKMRVKTMTNEFSLAEGESYVFAPEKHTSSGTKEMRHCTTPAT